MYKVFVVEDSKPIMRNIISLLHSIDNRLEIVGTAFNGREALQKLEKTNINILFTDIRMPFVDGLALIFEVKKIQPAIQCVIISGYDDFEYAKQAIKLGVNEYILKPVDAQELKNVIQNIIQAINLKIQLDMQRLLNESIINDLLYRKRIESCMPFHYFAFLLIRSGLFKRSNQSLDKAQIELCLRKAAVNYDFWILDTGYSGEIAVIFSLSQPDMTQLKSIIFQSHERLHKEISQVNIIVSNAYETKDILTIRELCFNLSNSLSSLIIIGESRVFEADITPTLPLTNFNEEAVNFQKKFNLLIKSRQLAMIQSELHKYCKDWEEKHYPAIFVKRFLVIILEELNMAYDNKESELISDMNSKVDNFLSHCLSYEAVYENTINYYMDYIGKFEQTRGKSIEELVTKIDIYLKANIYDTITLQNIANKFNISSSYVSRLMKMKYQISPMDYYMKLKMEEAKKLILTTDILIKDISDSLGFSDQHYFSKVFKAHTGSSPAQYRDNNQNHNPN